MNNNRTIYLDTPTRKGMALAAINDAPPDHEVVIRKRKVKRNLDQNACSWAIYTAIGKEVGESPQAIHDIALEAYAGKRTVKIAGMEFEVLNAHTSKFSVEEMSDYLNWLTAWATEHTGINARAIRRTYRVEDN